MPLRNNAFAFNIREYFSWKKRAAASIAFIRSARWFIEHLVACMYGNTASYEDNFLRATILNTKMTTVSYPPGTRIDIAFSFHSAGTQNFRR